MIFCCALFYGLFKETDAILKNKLDKLMLSFRITNPDFYTNYLNARIIVDLGVGTKTEVKPAV